MMIRSPTCHDLPTFWLSVPSSSGAAAYHATGVHKIARNVASGAYFLVTGKEASHTPRLSTLPPPLHAGGHAAARMPQAAASPVASPPPPKAAT